MTTAPTTATMKLQRFSPVTPGWPNWLKSHPPPTAPTMPSTISIRTPSPLLFTSLLATKPAIRPSTTQARIDIRLPTFPQDVLPDFSELPAQPARHDRSPEERLVESPTTVSSNVMA